MLRTIITGAFCTAYVIFAGIPLILWSMITGNVNVIYPATMWAVRLALRLGGVRVRLECLENIPTGVCIFAANHASNLDPPAFAALVPRRISVISKESVLRVPLVGTALRQGKIIGVDRANRESAIKSVDKAIEYIRGGLSFLVFPEGTRSPDGRLRAFRKGTFVMAIRAGVPIVPVSISGSQCILRKGDWRLHPGEMLIRFGVPVIPEPHHHEQKDALIAEVHARVAAGLPENQKPKDGEAVAVETHCRKETHAHG